MAKLTLKSLKKVTKIGKPIEKNIKWLAEVDDENIKLLSESSGEDLSVGEKIELDAEVFIKKLSFNDLHEITKAYEWEFDQEDVGKSKLKSVNVTALQAGHLIGSVCEDENGTPFFKSIEDVLNSEIPFIESLYAVADEVNNFMGKSRTQNSTKTKSGANSSSTELVEKPLKKPSQK
ncbi:phage tail assembly chaperone family protein, TAC [Acinetobacter bereziniae]|uniref:phage tail assembly chaperone family protein, TAC n=1 Tax=Acinetobacter bereziniae TaxID=106648 RepID=UPI00295431C2|nr:phage tail assembly chaperone family protein, TAC [Acinetobacter bereziniae]MDV8155196.1 phage tail assembly chaperone family protein, TAC [Acinetobacter bereziniae]